MTTRQVRLDPDVVDLVEARNPDGLSLSGATNRLLRELCAPARTSPQRRPVPPGGQPTRPVASRPAASPVGTSAVARRARRFGGGRCLHPEERRFGERCAQCGQVVR